MIDPRHTTRARILTLLAWLVVLGAFVAISSQNSIRLAAAETETTGWMLHRLISQRAAQHDAHLTSLIALTGTSTPSPEAAIRQVSESIVRFYPRIVGINLVEMAPDGNPPISKTLISVPDNKQAPDFSPIAAMIHQQKPGEVRTYLDASLPDQYLLAKRAPFEGRALGIVIEIAPALLLEPEEWPEWAHASLIFDGHPLLEHGAEKETDVPTFLPTLRFSKVVGSSSQPFVLNLERPLSLTDVIDWRATLIFGVLSLLALYALQLAWQQRARMRASERSAREAEKRAQLFEHETRLAHALRVNAMGELASGIAHELTQPLTALLSQSQAALRLASRDAPENAMLSQALAANVREAQRAGAMLKRVRDYISNKEETPAEQDVNRIASDIAELTQPYLLKRRIVLSLALVEPPPKVEINAIELEQVLHNLIRNAADALEENGSENGKIEMDMQIADSRLVIRVKDNGPGINDEVLPRLFEPFFTTKPDGMGLGLSLCATLIERAGGAIEAANQPTGGACFTITLPLAQQQAEAAQ